MCIDTYVKICKKLIVGTYIQELKKYKSLILKISLTGNHIFEILQHIKGNDLIYL